VAHSIVSTPDNSVGSKDNDNVITCLTWEEQMELEDAKLEADKVSKSAKHPKGRGLN